jgi:hypothetical protein
MEAKKPCKKPEPGRDAVPIVTNIHPMKIKEDVTVYRYDVLIAQYFDKPDGSGPGRIYLTKKSFGGEWVMFGLGNFTRCSLLCSPPTSVRQPTITGTSAARSSPCSSPTMRR